MTHVFGVLRKSRRSRTGRPPGPIHTTAGASRPPPKGGAMPRRGYLIDEAFGDYYGDWAHVRARGSPS